MDEMARGRKTGGRSKGTPNKRTAAKAAAIAASGMTPLEFMLGIMRDETQDLSERLEAAKSAAPYAHPRLATVEVQADVQVHHDVTDEPLTEGEWSAIHCKGQ